MPVTNRTINWGDEEKEAVAYRDLLARQADLVSPATRGGNNAGHTVVTDQG